MESSSLDRHRRKLCGHCNEMLSYSAYRSHKDMYYDRSTQSWITEYPAEDDPMHEYTANQEMEDFSELVELDTTDFDTPQADNSAHEMDTVYNQVWLEQDELPQECTMDNISDSSSEGN